MSMHVIRLFTVTLKKYSDASKQDSPNLTVTIFFAEFICWNEVWLEVNDSTKKYWTVVLRDHFSC